MRIIEFFPADSSIPMTFCNDIMPYFYISKYLFVFVIMSVVLFRHVKTKRVTTNESNAKLIMFGYSMFISNDFPVFSL